MWNSKVRNSLTRELFNGKFRANFKINKTSACHVYHNEHVLRKRKIFDKVVYDLVRVSSSRNIPIRPESW